MKWAFIVIVLLPFALGCKKDDLVPPGPGCPHSTSVDEIRDWYFFKEGSYWIYQEQQSGAIDTMTVYYHWDGVYNDNDHMEWYISRTLNNEEHRYRFNSSFSRNCADPSSCTCHKINKSAVTPGVSVNQTDLFLAPVFEGNWKLSFSQGNIPTETDTSRCEFVHPSWTNGSSTFNDVAEWHIGIDPTFGNSRVTYWIGRHAGIVRYVIEDLDEDWVCIESDVIQ